MRRSPAYDELGKLLTETDALGGTTSFVWDKARNLVLKQDANLDVTTYAYDALNQRSEEYQHLDGHSGPFTRDSVPSDVTPIDVNAGTGVLHWHWDYDENGNVERETDPKGQVRVSKRGILDRVEHEEFLNAAELPALTSLDYGHDHNGNVSSIAETRLLAVDQPAATVTTTRHFDGLDRLEDETRNGKTVAYSYDAKGNRQSVTHEGISTSYTYDAQDRLKTVTAGTQPATVQTYFVDGLLQSTALPNGVTEQHCYDAGGRLVHLTKATGSIDADTCVAASGVLSEYVYGYDEDGNRTQLTEARTVPATGGLRREVTHYRYDALDRLVKTAEPEGRVRLFKLDPVGNRIGERLTTDTSTSLDALSFDSVAVATLVQNTVATFNRLDWLTSLTDTVDPSKNATLTYDPNGNTTRRTVNGVTRDFHWDVRDTLTSVVQNGTVLGSYEYDWHLQRVSRKTAQESVTYVLDDKYVLAEANAATGANYRRYHYGATQPVAVDDGGGFRFIAVDAQGSASDFMTLAGQVQRAAQYDAWGRLRNGTAPSATDAKLGYTGHQEDIETGLVYARARYYDPELGRFLSRDTYEGQLADAPSLHRYGYVRGNPVRYTDFTGECINFFGKDLVSVANCIESAKALGNFAVGAGETAGRMVAGVLVAPALLTYNVTGAALYAATGESQYADQAQSFNEGLQGLIDTASHPLDAAANAVQRRYSVIRDAVDRGDAAAASRAVGSSAVELAAIVEGGAQLAKGGAALARRAAGAADGAMFAGSRAAMSEARTGLAQAERGFAEAEAQAPKCAGGECLTADNCFLAGTLVTTLAGKKAIESVQLGDWVLSRDESTGANVWEPVVSLYVTPEQRIVEVTLVDGNGHEEVVGVTTGHPFWTMDHGWRPAAMLEAGEPLSSATGQMLWVESVTGVTEAATVYNFEVEQTHSYFVGAGAVWVHNAGDCQIVEEANGGTEVQTRSGYVSGFREIRAKYRAAQSGDVGAMGEIEAAKVLRGEGQNVHFQTAGSLRSASGGTADFLVGGEARTGVGGTPYDVFTPTSGSTKRILSVTAGKATQTQRVILNLNHSPAAAEDFQDAVTSANRLLKSWNRVERLEEVKVIKTTQGEGP